MKRFVLWSVVPAFFALVVTAIYSFGSDSIQSPKKPVIAIAMQGKSSGGCDVIPAVKNAHAEDGRAILSQNGRQIYDIHMNYRVVSLSKDQLAVQVHYVIKWADSKQPIIVNRILPVWNGPPVQGSQWNVPPVKAKRIMVDRDIESCAYLAQTPE